MKTDILSAAKFQSEKRIIKSQIILTTISDETRSQSGAFFMYITPNSKVSGDWLWKGRFPCRWYCISNNYILIKENVQSMLAWLNKAVPVKKSFQLKKIKNQKKSRSIVDVYVGYSVVRRYILYVRYKIQALEHRWKRTWHSILWNRNRSLQDTWVSELSDTYDVCVLERSSARTLETMNLSELRVQSWLKRAWFWIPRHDKYCDHVRVASDHDIFDQVAYLETLSAWGSISTRRIDFVVNEDVTRDLFLDWCRASLCDDKMKRRLICILVHRLHQTNAFIYWEWWRTSIII